MTTYKKKVLCLNPHLGKDVGCESDPILNINYGLFSPYVQKITLVSTNKLIVNVINKI